MGITKRIKQFFAETIGDIPVGGRIYKSYSKEFSGGLKYDYATIENLLSDERVYSIINLFSSLAQNSYRTIELHAKNRYTDDELDDAEQNILIEAAEFARRLNFTQLYYDWAWGLASHGDIFEKIEKDENGIIDIKPFALNATRVLERESDRERRLGGVQINEENFICVKRNDNDTEPTIYKKEDYIHLSFKNRHVWRTDIQGSRAFSVYSVPPIATLQLLTKWKKKTIENDILWKNKLVPRTNYELSMPGINIGRYTGTQAEKIAAATKDAQKIQQDFIDSTHGLKPDDDLVHSDAVKASILEARSTNYHQPNETLSQINTLLGTPQGVPPGLLGGEGGASLGMEIAAIFSSIRVEYVVNKISLALEDLLKRHLALSRNGAQQEIIKRLYVCTDSTLAVEKFERIKTAVSMSATGCFTKGEIREAMNYPRLPQLPKEAFPETAMSDARSSIRQVESDVEKEEPNSRMNNRSPSGQRNTMSKNTL